MDLDANELRYLSRALRAPALWAFGVVVSRVGLARALELARAKTLPADLAVEFARAGWDASSVPPAGTLEQLITGVRVFARKRAGAKTKTAAEVLGLTFGAAVDALDALDLWCGPFLKRKGT